MHNEKKPRSGFVRTAFSIAASGALVLSDLTLTSSTSVPVVCKKTSEVTIVVEGTVNLTDAEGPVNEISEDAEIADAFEGAAIKTKSGASLTITGTGTLNVDGAACSVQRPSTQSRCASLRQALQRCGSKSQSMGWQHRVRFSKCPIGRYG